jgi:hypothetical protein
MNPSTEEIVAALEKVGTSRVVVLPNNKNIIMAAKTACELCDKEARAVPTRTIPQGVSAVLALDPDGDLDAVVDAMSDAAAEVAPGEITTATRDVEVDGIQVQRGHYLGLADGQICCAGPEEAEVVRETLEQMAVQECELLTLYYGAETSAQDAERVAALTERWHPHLEVEVVYGGQPHYFFIMSAE